MKKLQYDIYLIDESGKRLNEFPIPFKSEASSLILLEQNRILVEALQGKRYQIVVENFSDNDILVDATVDGLSVMTGKPREDDKPHGYILYKNKKLTIPGWRLSNNEVASFVFSELEWGYAAVKGVENKKVTGTIEVRIHKHIKPHVREELTIGRPGFTKPSNPSVWNTPRHPIFSNPPMYPPLTGDFYVGDNPMLEPTITCEDTTGATNGLSSHTISSSFGGGASRGSQISNFSSVRGQSASKPTKIGLRTKFASSILRSSEPSYMSFEKSPYMDGCLSASPSASMSMDAPQAGFSSYIPDSAVVDNERSLDFGEFSFDKGLLKDTGASRDTVGASMAAADTATEFGGKQSFRSELVDFEVESHADLIVELLYRSKSAIDSMDLKDPNTCEIPSVWRDNK